MDKGRIAIWLIIIVIVYLCIHYYNMSKDVCDMDEAIRILYRQSARYAYAAEQDKSPIIRVLHANYGAGYLFVLKDIASSSDFKRVMGEDMLEFEKRVVQIQDKATRELVGVCGAGLPGIDPVLLRGMY